MTRPSLVTECPLLISARGSMVELQPVSADAQIELVATPSAAHAWFAVFVGHMRRGVFSTKPHGQREPVRA